MRAYEEWRSYGTLHSKKMVGYRPDVPTGHGRLCSMGHIGFEEDPIGFDEGHWFKEDIFV